MEKVLINFQALDPIEFGKQVLLKFEIYLRITLILFAIIVFACISDQSLFTEADPTTGQPIVICLFNGDIGTCNYGITVGVIAFISNILFVCMDVIMEIVIHPIIYRIIALSMLLFNAFWGFNYFVLFCLLANRWSLTPEIVKNAISPLAFNDTQSIRGPGSQQLTDLTSTIEFWNTVLPLHFSLYRHIWMLGTTEIINMKEVLKRISIS